MALGIELFRILFASYCVIPKDSQLLSVKRRKRKERDKKNLWTRVCAQTQVCKSSRSSQCVLFFRLVISHFYVVLLLLLLLLFARLEWAIRQWWIHTEAKRIANHFTVCKKVRSEKKVTNLYYNNISLCTTLNWMDFIYFFFSVENVKSKNYSKEKC